MDRAHEIVPAQTAANPAFGRGIDWPRIAFVAAAILAVAAIAFPSLFYPFGRDQGIHAYIAKLAGDGLVVYRDIFNVKPPMTTVVHWLSQALFGETVRAIRLMDLAIVAATGVLLHCLAVRHLRSRWLGLVAVVAYAVLHFSKNFWTTAQTDGWCGLFMTAAMLAYSLALDARTPPRRLCLLAAAGLAVGLSFWLKYTTAAVLLVFPAVHLASGIAMRRTIVDGAAVAAGLVLCIGAGVAVLAAQGALVPFLDIQDFMRSYVSHNESPLLVLLVAVSPGLGAPAATAFAMLGFYAVYKSLAARRRIPEGVGLLAWLAAGFLSAAIQGKLLYYHTLPMQPPMAIAAAVGAGTFAQWVARRAKRDVLAPAALLACLLSVAVSQIPNQYRDILPVLNGEKSLRAYHADPAFGSEDFDSADNLALADYLKTQTMPCDTVFLWGFEPSVYFLSGRPHVTRFIYDFPMAAAYYRQFYRDELMDGLRAAPPAVFVVQHGNRMPHVSAHEHDSAEVMQQFAALDGFVGARYALRDRVGRFDVYFRNDIAPGRSCPAT